MCSYVYTFFRNQERELQDIKFDFVLGTHTPLGVSMELVLAGHIQARDRASTAASMQRVLGAPKGYSETFPCVSTDIPLREYRHSPA